MKNNINRLFFLLSILSWLMNCILTTKQTNKELFFGKYFEGDMILNAEQQREFIEGKPALKRIKRNALAYSEYLWPNDIVYYTISKELGKEFQLQIEKAIGVIESKSCVRFMHATLKNKAYVNYRDGSGCNSAMGYQNDLQYITLKADKLDEGCFRLGAIIHETLHALGFVHQQSVYDRDDYVTIHYENMEPQHEKNFVKMEQDSTNDFGTGYDYGSIMHYDKNAFSKNGLPTIVPLDPNAEIGQVIEMSEKDIIKLNRLYKCPTTKSKPTNYIRNFTTSNSYIKSILSKIKL